MIPENNTAGENEPRIIDVGLWDRLIYRKRDQGGITFLGTGILGSGKTSLLFTIARVLLTRGKPPEKLFWRGTFAAEFSKFSPSRLLVEKSIYPLQIFADDTPTNGYHQIEFDGYDDLYKKADPTSLNVVYVPNEMIFWTGFLNWLLEHNVGWSSLFLDEVEDIIPGYAQGEEWGVVSSFAVAVKEARKSNVSVYAATQNPGDIDWKFIRKIMAFGYLQGSRRIGPSPVFQRTINKTRIGTAWLTWGGLFEPVDFDPYKPSKTRLVIRGLRGGR